MRRTETKESKGPREVDGRRLSLDDGAEYVGVSKHTLRKLLRTKELAFYKIGRRVVLDRADLDRFLLSRRIDARG